MQVQTQIPPLMLQYKLMFGNCNGELNPRVKWTGNQTAARHIAAPIMQYLQETCRSGHVSKCKRLSKCLIIDNDIAYLEMKVISNKRFNIITLEIPVAKRKRTSRDSLFYGLLNWDEESRPCHRIFTEKCLSNFRAALICHEHQKKHPDRIRLNLNTRERDYDFELVRIMQNALSRQGHESSPLCELLSSEWNIGNLRNIDMFDHVAFAKAIQSILIPDLAHDARMKQLLIELRRQRSYPKYRVRNTTDLANRLFELRDNEDIGKLNMEQIKVNYDEEDEAVSISMHSFRRLLRKK